MTGLDLPDRLASADPARVSGSRSTRLWLLSVLIHGALLTALLITLPRLARGLKSPDDIEAREVGIVLKSENDDQVLFQNQDRTFAQPEESSELTPTMLEEMESPAVDASTDEVLPQLDDSLLATAGGKSGAMPSRPKSAGMSGGGRSKTTFWNVESVGSTFVFVIDRSASMAHRGALELAKEQLFQSLHQLAPENRFQVIFYNTEPQSMTLGEGELIESSSVNIARAKRDVDRISPEGGTQHTKPLELAFQFRPEVIYFLTDADMFNEEDVGRMTALNRRAPIPATIYAIEFGNGPNVTSDKPLRRLAAENDGAYSYINVQSFGASIGNPK